MTLADILQDLKLHRTEAHREVEAIDAAIQAIESGLDPARRPLTTRQPEASVAKRRAVTGPKPTATAAKKAAAKEAKSGPSVPATKTAPVDHVGRIPFARNVTRVDFADQDRAIGEARRLSDRGYNRQRERPLKPGGFDLLRTAGGFTLVFVERSSDDTHSAREAAA